MSVKLEMQGLAELRTALRNLPEDLAREGDVIVLAHAEDAARQIQTAYPEGPTGNLKRGVVVERNRSKFYTQGLVKSRAKHAWIFENGTDVRRTSKGANRGRMPQADETKRFIPKVVRLRARMVKQLVELVRRAGFQVNV